MIPLEDKEIIIVVEALRLCLAEDCLTINLKKRLEKITCKIVGYSELKINLNDLIEKLEDML